MASGYVLGRSSGSGFDLHGRPFGEHILRVVYADPQGEPVVHDLDLRAERQEIVPLAPPEPELPPDEPFIVDPHGVVEDTWPDLAASGVLSPDGRTVYIQKWGERGRGEWWQRGPRGVGRARHLWDNTRFPGDKGWYLRGGNWIAQRIHTGLVERFEDYLFDLHDPSKSRPWIYTMRYEVGHVRGKLAWQVWVDNRDELPAGVRRPGRVERFRFFEEGR